MHTSTCNSHRRSGSGPTSSECSRRHRVRCDPLAAPERLRSQAASHQQRLHARAICTDGAGNRLHRRFKQKQISRRRKEARPKFASCSPDTSKHSSGQIRHQSSNALEGSNKNSPLTGPANFAVLLSVERRGRDFHAATCSDNGKRKGIHSLKQSQPASGAMQISALTSGAHEASKQERSKCR